MYFVVEYHPKNNSPLWDIVAVEVSELVHFMPYIVVQDIKKKFFADILELTSFRA